MIKSIHQSTLNMFLRCGEQGRRRYIEDEIIPPGIAAGCGTGVHAGNKANMRQKIVSQQDLPLPDVKDATRDGYVYAFRNGIHLAKEEKSAKNTILNEGLNKSLRLAKLNHEEVAPKIQPIAVEERFKLDIGLELPLEGTMDYQKEPEIGDLKTAAKSWTEGQIEKEIQPVLYSFVHEIENNIRPKFTYHILVDLKSGPKLQEQEITVTDNHYKALFHKINMVIRMVKTGVFPPANPTSWWCEEKWCGYYNTCPYVGNTLPRREI